MPKPAIVSGSGKDEGAGMIVRPFLAVSLALLPMPALAASASAQVPEGSQLTLFALGVLGVIVGRRFAIRRGDSNSED